MPSENYEEVEMEVTLLTFIQLKLKVKRVVKIIDLKPCTYIESGIVRRYRYHYNGKALKRL
ncbi:hypothetical protein JCM16161A_23160 [Vulcanisaeta sp. JCM 16161]